MQNKYIFTFWEPRDNMPAYIQLCLETWKKYLPEYKIVLLDYANLSEYLAQELIDKILYKQMSLPKQADCIRAALLDQYGGIWLDADTIILNDNVLDMAENSVVKMIGTDAGVHGAFIYAASPKANLISTWLEEIISHVAKYRKWAGSWLWKHLCRKEYKRVMRWDYFLNAIINPLLHKYSEAELYVIDRDIIGAFPELKFANAKDAVSAYKDFYFNPNFKMSPDDIKKVANGGIILLHNSWTPEFYKKMSREEFLAQDIVMARLLAALLNEK